MCITPDLTLGYCILSPFLHAEIAGMCQQMQTPSFLKWLKILIGEFFWFRVCGLFKNTVVNNNEILKFVVKWIYKEY